MSDVANNGTRAVRNGSNTIYIQDLPKSWSREQAKALMDRLETQLEGQTFNGSLAQAQNLFTGQMSDAAALQERQRGGATASQEYLTREQMMADERVQSTDSSTDIGGLIGGAVRGVGSNIPGAALGLPGLVASNLAKPTTNALVTSINRLAEMGDNLSEKLGVEPIFDGKPALATVDEAFTWLFDSMGLPSPDSLPEEVVQNITNVVSQTLGTAKGADLLSNFIAQAKLQSLSGAPVTAGQTFLQMMADKPAQQAVGAASGVVGEQVASNAAEQANLGPVASQLATTGGGMLGDLVGSTAYDVGDILQQATGRRQIRELAPAGSRSPYTKSELEPPTTQGGVARQNVSESMIGGTGEFQFRRFNENQRELAEVMDRFGVPVDDLGNTPDLAKDLMDDFITTRGARLSENTQARNDVVQRLSEGGQTISTDKGVSAIDDLISRETALATTGSEGRAKLWANLREDIQGKTMDQLEMVRQDYGQMLRDQDMPDRMQQDLRNVYKEIFGTYSADGGRIPGDIDAFIAENGTEADLNQYLTANRELSTMAQDFRSRALNQVLDEWDKSPDTMNPEVVNNLLFSGDKSTVEQLYSSLSEDGRETARQALIGKFAETANTDDMSPSVFAQNVKRFGEQVGIFFRPEDVQFLTGLKQHFDLSKRSEEFVRNARGFQGLPTSSVPGGGTLLSMGVRGNPIAGGALSIASLGGLGKLSRIYEQSPQIKRLIKELATLEPGGEQAQNLSRLIERATIAAMEDRTVPRDSGTQERATPRNQDSLTR